MILAIDFDGTIVHDQFPSIGNLVEGAKEVINKLYGEGYTIIIWTCRTGIHKAEAVEFLAKNGIKFHRINESSPQNLIKYNGKDTRKVYADLYIDDKGISDLPHWNDIYEIVHERVPTRLDKIIQEGWL